MRKTARNYVHKHLIVIHNNLFHPVFLSLFLLAFSLLVAFAFSHLAQASAQTVPEVAQNHIPVCVVGNPNTPRCHARVVVNKSGKPQATTSPTGYGPAQFLGAYSLTATVSAPRTIAIVDAYHDPNALADLNIYSSTYGITQMNACPVSSGTVSNPCFQQINQNGGTAYPSVNSNWGLEISLDVQVAHAICQNCNILLVEASSNSYADLFAAVDRAVAMGAKVISNSYGSNEFSSETAYDGHFNVPGVAFTFSSGDNGYGPQYPAASRYVTAVGGTTLKLSNNSYLSESVWKGAGSGCSSYEGKPSWQKDTGCFRRTIADVSADADPNTGASIYDTSYNGQTGWWQVGGTSLASPLIAAVYAHANDVITAFPANSLPYTRASYGINLHDVNSGSNGMCRKTPYLCTGLSGYDGPSGLGTPLSVGAF